MQNLTKTAKHNLALVGVCIFVLIVVVVAVVLASPRNVTSGPVGESNASAQQVDGLVLPLVPLEGDWKVQNNDYSFAAKVEGSTIKIEMLSGDGYSAVYWHGTFKTAESPNNTIVSTKTEASDEIVLSQDDTKSFAIGTDGITFKYSVLGFSKMVTLTR